MYSGVYRNIYIAEEIKVLIKHVENKCNQLFTNICKKYLKFSIWYVKVINNTLILYERFIYRKIG